jgi:hypothetical protein
VTAEGEVPSFHTFFLSLNLFAGEEAIELENFLYPLCSNDSDAVATEMCVWTV